jgi:hypothetical protein
MQMKIDSTLQSQKGETSKFRLRKLQNLQIEGRTYGNISIEEEITPTLGLTLIDCLRLYLPIGTMHKKAI